MTLAAHVRAAPVQAVADEGEAGAGERGATGRGGGGRRCERTGTGRERDRMRTHRDH